MFSVEATVPLAPTFSSPTAPSPTKSLKGAKVPPVTLAVPVPPPAPTPMSAVPLTVKVPAVTLRRPVAPLSPTLKVLASTIPLALIVPSPEAPPRPA